MIIQRCETYVNFVDLEMILNMLQNEHSSAQIGFDTAENEPSKVFLHFSVLWLRRDPVFSSPAGRAVRRFGPGDRVRRRDWRALMYPGREKPGAQEAELKASRLQVP